MTTNKKKKNIRQRGKRWHGWGRGHAHHKGAGNRGGRGRAGTGKRADHNKAKTWKIEHYFGKFGFKKKGAVREIKAINTDYLEKNIERLVRNELAELKGGIYIVDISKLGYNKLLAKGKVNKKFNITCEIASPGAKENIEAAGGSVVVSGEEKTETEQNE